MTLKYRIAKALEVLSDSDFQRAMRSNDILVVYYASVMLGSKLSKRYNNILMCRNAVPNWWHENSLRSDCKINFAFKNAFAQIVKYIDESYSITPGRIRKLQDILYNERHEYQKERRNFTDNVILRQYLRNLNDLRMHCVEMTETERYDFSFDMVYDFINELSLSKKTLALSFLIMYWIQREQNLIPLVVDCVKDVFLSALDSQSEDMLTEKERKKKFRLFMRKLLDLHLKRFIKNASKDCRKSTSRERILKLIKDNHRHTAKTMASCLGLSVQAIQKQIAILKTEKRLERIGPDNGGRWKVLAE